MAVSDQYLQPVVHMSESSISKFWNANSVHSSLRSITNVNYNGDGVSSTSSAMRIPFPSESPPNTYFNAASCSTSFSRSASHNSNSLYSDWISRTDTNYNGGGVYSTSSAIILSSLISPPNTELNSDPCYTILSLINNKSIGGVSSAYYPFVGSKE